MLLFFYIHFTRNRSWCNVGLYMPIYIALMSWWYETMMHGRRIDGRTDGRSFYAVLDNNQRMVSLLSIKQYNNIIIQHISLILANKTSCTVTVTHTHPQRETACTDWRVRIKFNSIQSIDVLTDFMAWPGCAVLLIEYRSFLLITSHQQQHRYTYTRRYQYPPR